MADQGSAAKRMMNKVALFLNRFWTGWILVHGAFVAGISVFEIPLILSNFLIVFHDT